MMAEKNQVIDVGNGLKTRLNSKYFMKSMQITLAIISGILVTIYWIYGLYHHYDACTKY